MKIYLVNRENDSEHPWTDMEKAFTTLEKAKKYKEELEEQHKDDIRFQYKFWTYEIEEIEVE